MAKLVDPEVFLVGYTTADPVGLVAYLKASGNEAFLNDLREAQQAGLSDGEILCSMAAKLCYKSLSLGHNSNVKRLRAIEDNLKAVYSTGHGSVLEHCQLNFVVRNLSRVATHELVRHRAGFAFSQTSGRYCRLDEIDLVWDSILDPVKDEMMEQLKSIEDTVYLVECRLGLRKMPKSGEPASLYLTTRLEEHRWVPDDTFDFEKRKKLTSAIRRIAPNGQANEVFFSVNLRALRHVVQLRTSRHAEQEIRNIFGQVYTLVQRKFPSVFADAKLTMHDDLIEVSNMRQQPYDIMQPEEK